MNRWSCIQTEITKLCKWLLDSEQSIVDSGESVKTPDCEPKRRSFCYKLCHLTRHVREIRSANIFLNLKRPQLSLKIPSYRPLKKAHVYKIRTSRKLISDKKWQSVWDWWRGMILGKRRYISIQDFISSFEIRYWSIKAKNRFVSIRSNSKPN